ncbi:MAG: hypothetical protein HRU19_19575 [Pseudobacteriovorax sp.]|nr:hypothetical protein [Pseudobacteriovorax sp.]
MLGIKQDFKFGDKVFVKSGFYQGQTAILTYFCPETGCLCGHIEGDGTDQLHYFYEDQLDFRDRGYFFGGDADEMEENAQVEPSFVPKIVPGRDQKRQNRPKKPNT